jgi:hypothetical protein
LTSQPAVPPTACTSRLQPGTYQRAFLLPATRLRLDPPGESHNRITPAVIDMACIFSLISLCSHLLVSCGPGTDDNANYPAPKDTSGNKPCQTLRSAVDKCAPTNKNIPRVKRLQKSFLCLCRELFIKWRRFPMKRLAFFRQAM